MYGEKKRKEENGWECYKIYLGMMYGANEVAYGHTSDVT